MGKNNRIPPTYLRYHWAKAERENPEHLHLLEHHLADVSACFEALLAQPTIRQRLARAGNLDDIDPVTAARLCVFVALHDIGKINIGFQTRIWQEEDLQGRPRPSVWGNRHRTGHVKELTPILNGKDRQTSQWFFDVLNWDDLLQWDSDDGLTVCGLFTATMSHHGLPIQLDSTTQPNPGIWQPFGELHPQHYSERIVQLVRQWFSEAFAAGTPLPSAPAFQHMFLGLCTLADWIGSDKSRFPFLDKPQDDYITVARARAAEAVSEIGIDIRKQKECFQGVLDFNRLFTIPGAASANAIQQQAAQETPLDEPLVIIESETGSGKTEAALWRFARMYESGLVDGLYFALPTRAAASQIHGRVKRFSDNLFPDGMAPEPVLAVPGYLRAGDATGKLLPDYQVWWDDHPDDVTRNLRWAAESAKRYLAAQIAVGTVDQAMMAAIKVKHAHMRAACLARNLLVVDEVHASDTYMGAILEALLEAHLNAGGYALLMSATLGSVARRRWLLRGQHTIREDLPLDDAISIPYPAVSTRSFDKDNDENVVPAGENNKDKTVRMEAIPAMPDFAQVAERALQAARAGAKVLVIRNTVNFAISTQHAVESAAAPDEHDLLFAHNGITTLHHGRFAANDRRLLDEQIETLLGKDSAPGGRIVVGTQTLEQSLDIDADLLITDLCPVDVLLQRIGRLHRHQRDDRPAGAQEPVCIVLTPEGNDLSFLLTSRQNTNGLGLNGKVYEDLRIIEATRRLIDKYSAWHIPKMNRELVERATYPDALAIIVKEMGEKWQEHYIQVQGAQIADNLTAGDAIIKRDKSFYEDNREVVFGSIEERIRTRLGDEGIEVKFEPAPPSPFNAEKIARLTIPAHLLPQNIDSDDSVTPNLTDGGFDFSISTQKFQYDRLGLRRIS